MTPGSWAARLHRRVMASAEIVWSRSGDMCDLRLERCAGLYTARALSLEAGSRAACASSAAAALRGLSLRLAHKRDAEAAAAWAQDIDARGLRLRDAESVRFRAEVKIQ